MRHRRNRRNILTAALFLAFALALALHEVHVDLLLSVTVLCGAVSSTAFVVRYAFYRWERTTTGRSIMALSVAVAILSWLYLVRVIDYYYWEDFTIDAWLQPINAFFWIVLTTVFVWRFDQLGVDEDSHVLGVKPPKKRDEHRRS